MRVVFCHDGPLKKDEFNNYYGSAHNDNTFKRYFSIADQLTVLIRITNISEALARKSLSKITIPFQVKQVPNISSVKGLLTQRSEAKKIIFSEILKSDFVVARMPSSIGKIAIDVARKLRKPCLIELVTCPWDSLWNHSLRGKLMAPIRYYETKQRVLNASHVLYVTNNFLQKRYPTMGKNINCSNVVLPNINEASLLIRLNLINSKPNQDKIVIGTTAAVNLRFKGQQYIIEALGKMKKQGLNNYEYQLVGGGDQSYLRNLAIKFDVIDQIKFLGSLPHQEIFNWLEKIDLYVQPSRQEGLPRALIEAMSMGVPSFGANTAGIPELLASDFIFSNSRNNIKEIISIIKKFDSKVMREQAQRNFNEAKSYNSCLLEKRREKFFIDFLKSKDLRRE